MKISCIIPVYNTSKYLRKCVDSVLTQTYSNLELILVNDCSTDDSAEICRKYQIAYPDRVTLINKTLNEGVDRARFTGLERVLRNNYRGGVIFVDSDDYLEKDAIRRLAEEMIRTDSDVVQMRAKRVWGLIRRPYFAPIAPQVIDQPKLFDEYFISFFGVNRLDVWMCSKLYRVETIAKAGLKPSGFKMGEDLMFNMRLFPHYKRYALIDYRGYNYRVGGLTSRYNPTLWEDLKKQYYEKRQFAHDLRYTKAIRPLNIELKNILMSTLCQRMEYLNRTYADLCAWLDMQLADRNLWADIIKMAPSEKDPVYTYIAGQNVAAIVAIAQQQWKSHRYRRMTKKILSYIVR